MDRPFALKAAGPLNVRPFVLKRIADLAGLWYSLSLVATVLVGIGGLGYIGFKWFAYFAQGGQYAACGVLLVVGLATLSLAALRVPLALFLLFGGASLVGTAYFVGATNVLLP